MIKKFYLSMLVVCLLLSATSLHATFIKDFRIKADDSASVDAFGRWRTSSPITLFDSKQIFDNQPLFWDESLESGAGITSSHDVNEAATTITSTLNTAGTFTRQTFMRFDYQPGKSQQIIMTGTLDLSGGGTGVQRRIGQFDDDNGLFFEDDEGTVKVVMRSKVSGSVVNTKVAQSSWNLDVMDGTGVSSVTVDWTKSQIFTMDYEWLSVGRVRFGLVTDGQIFYIHEFNNANIIAGAYMSTPNLPLRYQMVTTGSSPASTMLCICSTVISEGGSQELGSLRYKSTEGTHINANTADVIYAIVGVRLKTTHLGASIKLVSQTLINATTDDYEWLVILNPTLANAITFSDETNSAVQTGVGNSGNPSNSTVTGGTVIGGGMVKSGSNSGAATIPLDNAILLGSGIDGTRDEIYLCVRPFSANADIDGGLVWRESN